MISTNNFHPISDPKLLCTCGDSRCDKRSVDQDTLNRAQCVRDDANRPLSVRSGGRCPYHEEQQKKDDPNGGDHPACKGLDFGVNGGLERGQIVSLGIKHGFNAIGVAKTFVHLGVRPELAPGQIMMWKY
jgi:hypothetical protein